MINSIDHADWHVDLPQFNLEKNAQGPVLNGYQLRDIHPLFFGT